METVFVALRVVLSLAVVLGLLWVLHRRISRGTRARTISNPIVIVGRQAVGQKSSVVIVEVDGHRMLLGVTEQQVSVLHEEEIRRASVDDVEFTRIMAEAAELRESVPASASIDPQRKAPARMPIAAPLTGRVAAAVTTAIAAPLAATFAVAEKSTASAAQPAFTVDSASASGTVPTPVSGAPALSGSILSAATWKQAAAALRLTK